MKRTAVLRLAVTSEQEALLDGQAHAARWFWNAIHEWYTACRENGKYGPDEAEMDRQIRGMLQNPLPGYEWLRVLSSHSLQHVHQDYMQAWHRCWSKRPTLKSKHAPKFKSRTRTKMSFEQSGRSQVRRLSRRVGEINLPKIGWVRFRWNQQLPKNALRGARIVKEANGWHAYVRLDLLDPAPQEIAGSVGIDRGVVHALVTSDGEFFNMPPLFTVGDKKRLLRLERSAARKRRARKKGAPISKRLEKEYDQIRALRARAKRRRRDWQHKVTTELCRRYGLVALEKLNVSSMTRSAKGSVESPGMNVRQKSGLNRAILDVGWSQIESMLVYKTAERGSEVVKVPARYTSQTCSACGHRAKESRIAQSRFKCVACGVALNADLNAAKNIHAAGLAVSGRGGLVTRQPTKRQSASARAEAYVS